MDAFRHPRLRRPRIPDFLESGRQDRPTLEALLDEAEKYVQLRHGVVHGIYVRITYSPSSSHAGRPPADSCSR
jgi:hypothetical protein